MGTWDTIESRHAEAEREFLYKTTRSITQSATFDEELQAALQDICEGTDWTYAEAWIPTEEGKLRRAEANYYTDDLAEFAEFSKGYTFARGEGLPGRIWASGEFEWAADLPSGLRGEFPRLDEARRVGLNSTLGVPVVADDEVVAVLTFLMREAREIDDRLVKQVSSVAAELGEFISRRRVEKRLARERDLVERVLETIPIGVGVYSSDGETIRANERAKNRLGIDRVNDGSYEIGDGDVYDAEGEYIPLEERPYLGVFETGAPVEGWHCQIDLPDEGMRWISINAEPIVGESGQVERVIVTSSDVTRLKRQAEQLRRQRDDVAAELDEVFDRIEDAFYAIDEDFRFNYVNERAEELLGAEESALLGESVFEAFPEAAETDAWDAFNDALENQEPTGYELYYEPLDFWVSARVYPSESGLSIYFRNISERNQRERELEESKNRYRALVENFPNGIVTLFDEDFRYQIAGGELFEEFGRSPEDMVGQTIYERNAPEDVALLEPAYEAAMSGESSSFETEYAGRVVEVRTVPVRDETGTVFAGMAMSQDITERKQTEEKLREKEAKLSVILTQLPVAVGVLDTDGRFELQNDRMEEVIAGDLMPSIDSEQQDVWSATDDHGEQLPPEQWPGARALRGEDVSNGIVFRLERDETTRWMHVAATPLRHDGTATGAIVIIEDITERKRHERDLERHERIVETVPDGVYALDSDDQFVLVSQAFCDLVGYDRERLLGAHPTLINSQAVNDTANDLQAEIQAGERNVGVVVAEFETVTGETVPVEGRIAPFEYEDGHVGRCGVVRDVTEQKRREENLAALNRLNRVFQDVTHAIIESSSREEIEQTITNQLTNSDSYEYAWIGHLDRHGEKIVPQIAGMDEVGLSEVTLSTAIDDPTSHGPVAKAIRTGEVQVTYDSTADPVFDQWNQAHDLRHRAGISIPIVYEERVYGVLNVYTARENAFDENERRIMRRISDAVGHAINAIERKRALLEDQVQEITFQSQRFAEIFTDATDCESFTVSIEKFVTLPDDQSIAYYSLDRLDPAVFTDVIEQYNPDAEHHVIDEEGSRARVEVQQSDLALAAELAKYNSWIADGILQNGEFRLRVQVPKHSHVREVKDAVKEAYPDVEVLAQTEVERESARLIDAFSDLDNQLTERQRTALEVAFYSGYFDWPRAITGEELAERLDVTQGTISHHLRHGEHKLLSAFFDLAE